MPDTDNKQTGGDKDKNTPESDTNRDAPGNARENGEAGPSQEDRKKSLQNGRKSTAAVEGASPAAPGPSKPEGGIGRFRIWGVRKDFNGLLNRLLIASLQNRTHNYTNIHKKLYQEIKCMYYKYNKRMYY
jgi:hypothetical protein